MTAAWLSGEPFDFNSSGRSVASPLPAGRPDDLAPLPAGDASKGGESDAGVRPSASPSSASVSGRSSASSGVAEGTAGIPPLGSDRHAGPGERVQAVVGAVHETAVRAEGSDDLAEMLFQECWPWGLA